MAAKAAAAGGSGGNSSQAARELWVPDVEEGEEGAAEGSSGRGGGGEGALVVDVLCGTLQGTFSAGTMMITLHSGRRVAPREFERMAGRPQSKKWKWSIRVDSGGGVPGITLEDWLESQGLDTAAAPRPRSTTLSAIHRRQLAAGGRRGGRRAMADAAARQKQQQAQGGVQAEGGAPRQRDGKRAFLRALPQLATAGPMPHELHEVPLSRCWTPEDWAAHRLRQVARAAAAAGGGAPARMRAADLAPVVATNPAAYADSLAPQVSVGPGVHNERPLSVKEKLVLCHATEHARIAFGKSGIHGWGLFARAPMKQDSMVTEYRGVLLRASVAEARERRYRAQGRDCFLFNLDDQHVLDSTEAGALCRFTNHSCAPSMYSKILNVGGTQRLVFFARSGWRIVV
jgi:hypothetical protein